jgi:hypothetical protein
MRGSLTDPRPIELLKASIKRGMASSQQSTLSRYLDYHIHDGNNDKVAEVLTLLKLKCLHGQLDGVLIE